MLNSAADAAAGEKGNNAVAVSLAVRTSGTIGLKVSAAVCCEAMKVTKAMMNLSILCTVPTKK